MQNWLLITYPPPKPLQILLAAKYVCTLSANLEGWLFTAKLICGHWKASYQCFPLMHSTKGKRVILPLFPSSSPFPHCVCQHLLWLFTVENQQFLEASVRISDWQMGNDSTLTGIKMQIKPHSLGDIYSKTLEGGDTQSTLHQRCTSHFINAYMLSYSFMFWLLRTTMVLEHLFLMEQCSRVTQYNLMHYLDDCIWRLVFPTQTAAPYCHHLFLQCAVCTPNMLMTMLF